jgi:hypothetical protein
LSLTETRTALFKKLNSESGTAILSLGVPGANCRRIERRAGVFCDFWKSQLGVSRQRLRHITKQVKPLGTMQLSQRHYPNSILLSSTTAWSATSYWLRPYYDRGLRPA